MKKDDSAAETAQEKGQPEDSWQNGLLTILISVQKETEIGQISRAVMGCDGDKLNIWGLKKGEMTVYSLYVMENIS